jgi:hypothetical protein
MGKKPGDLYLGQALDSESSQPTGTRLHLPSHQLTTHGVIVGMTGSGKTGLGVILLEEILSAGIPALILDPKGDMGNLLLNFPAFRPQDFEPWIDGGEARRKGITPGQLAEEKARLWQQGLAASGVEPERMERLRRNVDLRVITPGSSAGIPLNVLGNLAPPGVSLEEDPETVRDEIEGLVSGILVMAGLDSDPLTSKEHILLSNLVEQSWREGRGLELATLIGQIQQPPLRRLGVFDLEAFFPERDRTKLAMRMNGLVASPSFAEWIRGEPLDVGGLLRAPDGRPRASVVYLAHLTDTERVFVVTLLLSKLVTWMRRQPGTSALRAFVYADEVMGLAPPTAEPPSKRPILTLFKQARAHGVGVVLATQNPVDMDYKLMSNAGTWMVGRLQTERDKARIIEAMRSASGDVDVRAWDARIGALGKRQFVMKTAGSDEPLLFSTRWAMSYLRGPLTRAELLRLKTDGLMADGATMPLGVPTGPGQPPFATPSAPGQPPVPPQAGAAAFGAPGLPSHAPAEGVPWPSGQGGPAGPPHTTPSQAAVTPPFHSPTASLAHDESPVAPRVSQEAVVRYLDPAAPWISEVGVRPGGRRLEPGLAARVKLLFDEPRSGLRHEEEWEAVFFPLGDAIRPHEAKIVDYDPRDFREEPPANTVYALPQAPLDQASFFRTSGKAITDHLYRNRTVTLFQNGALKLYSRVDESEEEFRKRCLEAAEERADGDAGKLRTSYESKLRTARNRQSQAERRVRELEVDTSQRRQQELIAGAGEILSLFLGGRSRTRSLSGMSSRRSQTVRTKERLRSAEEKLGEYEQAILDLERELGLELEGIWERWRATAGQIEPFEVRLKQRDIVLDELLLFWAPAG